jgi:hypothetical protein
MGNRKGIIYEANERLDAKMKLKESRFEEKKARREAGEHVWTFSSGLIHSHGTRNAYQQHIMRFIQWSRNHYGIRRLSLLDERADELATEYLSERLTQGCSPYTIQAERAALRLTPSRGDHPLSERDRPRSGIPAAELAALDSLSRCDRITPGRGNATQG